MTPRTSVSPLIDLCSAEAVKQYECGLWWRSHAWRTESDVPCGPLPDSYFVENFKACVARHEFDMNASAQHTAQDTICFWLGMIHGGVLSPDTGLLRPDVTTLVIITHPEFGRGYNVGRRWYFFDAMPDEDRRYTDKRVMQEMRELVAEEPEEFALGADDTCIQYCVGSLLGALSARLFLMTEEEHQQWEAEYQCLLARFQQDRVTEPLVQPVPQHV